MADMIKYLPNRIRAQFSANSTAWQIIATDGVGYDSYQALLDAGKTKFPGTPAQFPTGIPRLLVRSVTSAGTVDGDTFQVATNTLISPALSDDLVSGSGQTLIYEDADVTSVWVKKTTGTNIVINTGMF